MTRRGGWIGRFTWCVASSTRSSLFPFDLVEVDPSQGTPLSLCTSMSVKAD